MVSSGTHDSIVILGATATGKTSLGVFLSTSFGGEIISADSRQVYRGLDLGSGKDLAEYGTIPYHLIDVTDLSSEYSVFDFQRDFFRVFAEISSRGRVPVVVGGTGMYIDSIVRGYSLAEVPVNPALRAELAGLSLEELVARLLSKKKDVHNRTDLVERPRLVRAIEIAEYCPPPDAESARRAERSLLAEGASRPEGEPKPLLKPLILGVRFERSVLRERIRIRLDERLRAGMVAEVRALHDAGASWERLERLGLEYRYTAEYLTGKIPSLDDYTKSLYTAICQFAKRQETWFRGMERKGVSIHWIENGDRESAMETVTRSFRPA